MSYDIHETITARIVDQIEAGLTGVLVMPWHTATATAPAVNVLSGAEYNGVNRLLLTLAQTSLGYSSNQWATYKQWQEMGAQVRKGEKSCPVVKYGTFEDKSDDAADDEERRVRGFLKGYHVFNADQVDGYAAAPAALPYPLNPEDRLSAAEVFFGNLGADIREGGTRAFFNGNADYIQMPDWSRFKSAEGFYAILSHEATHWTGHGLRLDRDQSGAFGCAEYAFEELVAELGAAFMCAHLGLSNEPREDHAHYIASWLKALKDDKRMIFRAATLAQKAVDFMKAKQSSPARSAPERLPVSQPPMLQAAAQLSLF